MESLWFSFSVASCSSMFFANSWNIVRLIERMPLCSLICCETSISRSSCPTVFEVVGRHPRDQLQLLCVIMHGLDLQPIGGGMHVILDFWLLGAGRHGSDDLEVLGDSRHVDNAVDMLTVGMCVRQDFQLLSVMLTGVMLLDDAVGADHLENRLCVPNTTGR